MKNALKEEFFEKEVPGNPLKAEYLIPIFIGELLEQGKMAVKVLKTNDTWYGMTYHEDVAAVKDSFKKMLENGVYTGLLHACRAENVDARSVWQLKNVFCRQLYTWHFDER